MLAADPHRDPGRVCAVDLHRRAGRVTGAAAHALLLVDLERGFAVDQRRPDRGDRATRDDRRPFAHFRDQIVIDLRRLGVLHVDRDVALSAAIDLAARGGDLHPARHLLADELVVHHIHQALDDAGGVGAGNVAMQPALGVRDHRHRIAGAADRKARRGQRVDQRLNLVLRTHHELDVAARSEPDVALGELIADVAELADDEDVHLARRAGAHRPHLVAALGDVMQHSRARTVVPGPVAVILDQQGMHIRKRIRHPGFVGTAHLDSGTHRSRPPRNVVIGCGRGGSPGRSAQADPRRVIPRRPPDRLRALCVRNISPLPR